MWPFGQSKKQDDNCGKALKRLIAGIVIGGAITSVVGKKMLEKHDEELDEENEDREE